MKKSVITPGNITLSLLMMVFIISLSVILVLNFRPLYYFDIDYLDIPETSGYSEAEIRENYDVLIDYNSMFNDSELEFPSLRMSTTGKIHFEEVKAIFVAFQWLFVITTLICIGALIYKIKRRDFDFLTLTGILTIIVPLILGGLIAANWDFAFVAFHNIAFDNDYWIFNAATDPVITILPDEFFMHCAILILTITVLLSALCIGLGQYLIHSQHQKYQSNLFP